MAAGNQVSSLNRAGIDHHAVLDWITANVREQEKFIYSALRLRVAHDVMGQWATQVKGIGPGIAAALIAYIDPEKALAAGNVWSIFGVNPRQRWLGKAKAEEWVNAQTGTPMEILTRASATFSRRLPPMLRWATANKKGKPVKLTNERIAAVLAQVARACPNQINL